jgi:cell division protein FtsZ
VNITGGNDITLFEVDEAANKIRAEVDPGADILIGNTIDEAMTGKVRVSIVVTGLGGEVVKNRPTLSVVQNRNGYSGHNLFNNNSTNQQQSNSYAAYMSNQPYMPTSVTNPSMSTTQSTHVSGANALDLGTINQSNQSITPDIKTNYQEIQENIKIEDPIEQDFLRDEPNLDNNNEGNTFETKSLNDDKNMYQLSEEENLEAPQLFTSDDELHQTEDINQANSEDTDLSDLNFDDKDDLEIPAFLRRQTN